MCVPYSAHGLEKRTTDSRKQSMNCVVPIQNGTSDYNRCRNDAYYPAAKIHIPAAPHAESRARRPPVRLYRPDEAPPEHKYVMDKIVTGNPETHSTDIIAENLEKLKALLPEAFTEGKVDFDVLRQLLGDAVNDGEEKYGLNWHGKRKARQLALTPSTGTLRPCPEDSVNWDTTQNLMIEGDNLEVLKLLQKSYAGKVNLIYIDPPYNTGKDFVYPDNYHDNIKNYLKLTGQIDKDIEGGGGKQSSNSETSGRFHTKWLNMMYPRLKLARDFLCDNGAFFASIDEHELSNICHLLDNIFGEENNIGIICSSLNPKGRQLSQFFATSHEYIVIYAKNIEKCAVNPSSAHLVNKSDFPLIDF